MPILATLGMTRPHPSADLQLETLVEKLHERRLIPKRKRPARKAGRVGRRSIEERPLVPMRCYDATLTSMALGRGFSALGKCTRRTPSLKSAATFVSSASAGTVKVRRNVP